MLQDLFAKYPDILKIIAAPLVGLVPVLINIIINWLDKKSVAAKRNAELIYVNQRVSFLMNWYNIQQQIGDPSHLPEIKRRLTEELRDVYSDFAAALVDVNDLTKEREEKIQRVRNTSAFRKYFLFYTPYNVWGWLYHTLYYMTLVPTLVLIGIVVYEYATQTVSPAILYYQIAAVVLFILAGVFRVLGRQAAKPEEKRLTAIDRKTQPLGNMAIS